MANYMNTEEIKLGPAKLYYFDDNGDKVAIGATEDNITLELSAEYFDILASQTGKMILKKFVIGENATLKCSMLETTKENLQLAIPGITLFGSGANVSAGYGSNSGADLLTDAKTFYVHPVNTRGANNVDDETFVDNDVTIWKGANTAAVPIVYGNEEARKFDMEIVCFPDTSQDSGLYLLVVGDPDVVVDTDPPAILQSYPANGVAAIPTSAVVEISFDREIRGSEPDAPLGIFELKVDSSGVDVPGAVGSYDKELTGTATAATGTTLVDASSDTPLPDNDDILNGAKIIITEGAGKGDDEIAITDYVASTNTITVGAWLNGTPDNTSKYKIINSVLQFTPTSTLSALTKYKMVVANTVSLTGYHSKIKIFDFTTA